MASSSTNLLIEALTSFVRSVVDTAVIMNATILDSIIALPHYVSRKLTAHVEMPI